MTNNSKAMPLNFKDKSHVQKYHLLKGKDEDLGIQITGGKGSQLHGIYISYLLDGGAAYRDGRLKIGDELLFVNGHPLISATLQEAITILKSIANPIQVIISRPINTNPNVKESSIETNKIFLTNDKENTTQITKSVICEIILYNEEGKLGFSITGGRTPKQSGKIFVKSILPGGIAEADGRLNIGDEVIKVNNKVLSGLTHQEAVDYFKSLQKGFVRLLVQPSIVKENDNSVYTVLLNKVPGKGLGFGIGPYNKKNDEIVIKYISKNSEIYKKDVRLKDQLLSINGMSVTKLSVGETYKLLRSLKPGLVKLELKKKNKHSDALFGSDDFSYQKTELSESPEDHLLNSLMSPATPVKGNKKGNPMSVISWYESGISDEEKSILSDASLNFGDNVEQNFPNMEVHPSIINKSNNIWCGSDNNNMDSANDTDNENINILQKNQINNSVKENLDYLILERDLNGNVGFGIKIRKKENGFQVLVKSVVEDGPANLAKGSKFGGLRVGDHIVQVNDKLLDNLNTKQIITAFKNMPKTSIIALKRKPLDDNDDETINMPNYVHDFSKLYMEQQLSNKKVQQKKKEGSIDNKKSYACRAYNEITPENVPFGYRVHQFSINKNDFTGFNLAPAGSKCYGFYQLQNILSRNLSFESCLLHGDILYSINGIIMNSFSYSQVQQILKQCLMLADVTVFREYVLSTSECLIKNGHSSENKINEISIERHPSNKIRMDEEESDVSFCGIASLPECVAINSRSAAGPFLVECNKTFKCLGLDVMVDENGDCVITNISPAGILAKNDLIRTSDHLVAINGQLVTGKPVSFIKDLLRNIPRGKVQIIVCAAQPTLDTTQAALDNKANNDLNYSRNKLTNANGSTKVKMESKCKAKVKVNKNSYPSNGIQQNFSYQAFADDASDMASLPPAPSRPEFQHVNCFNHPQSKECLDDDLESMFSSVPAPPPPINFQPMGIVDTELNEKVCNTKPTRILAENSNLDFFEKMSSQKSIVCNNTDSEEGYSSDSTNGSFTKSATSFGDESNNSLPSSPSFGNTNASLTNLQQSNSNMVASINSKSFTKESIQESKSIYEQVSGFSKYLKPDLTLKPDTMIYSSIQGNGGDVNVDDGDIIDYCPQSFNTKKNLTKKKSFLSKLKSKVLLPSKSSLKQSEQMKKPYQNENHELESMEYKKSPNRQDLTTSNNITSSDKLNNFERIHLRQNLASSVHSIEQIATNTLVCGRIDVQDGKQDMQQNSLICNASSSNSQSKSSYAAEGPTALTNLLNSNKIELFSEINHGVETITSSYMTNQLTACKVSMDLSTSMPLFLNKSLSQSKESVSSLTSNDSKKRAPSLQELFFPPPPLSYDVEEDSPPNSAPEKPKINSKVLEINNKDHLTQSLSKSIGLNDNRHFILAKKLDFENGESSSINENPIPKPPRRYSHEQNAKFEKIESNQDNDTVLSDMNQLSNEYQNIYYLKDSFQNASSTLYNPTENFFASNEEINITEEVSPRISPKDINQLYASVDFSKKKPSTPSKNELNASLTRSNFRIDNMQNEKMSKKENTFKVELLKERGKPLGIVITGGNNTVAKLVLIKEVSKNSIANRCSIPLLPGDEIIEVNGQNVTGLSHNDVLNTLKNSPPLLKLKINRKAHRNTELLTLLENETTVPKMNSGNFLSNIKDTTQNPVGSELVRVTSPTSINVKNQLLSLETFDTTNLDSRKVVFSTPPIAPRRYNSLPRSKSSLSPKTSRSYVNEKSNILNDTFCNDTLLSNISLVGSNSSLHDNSGCRTLIEIDLHKAQGRGLGIGVYGGPKSIITDGIKVKRLVPESIAGLDGRLQGGDLIIAINGTPLRGLTQGDALGMLKTIPDCILLKVLRKESLIEKNDGAHEKRRSRSQISSGSQPRSRSVEDMRHRSLSSLPPKCHASTDCLNQKDVKLKRKRSFIDILSRSFSKGSLKPELYTVYLDKECDQFDFTLDGGKDTIYGLTPIIVKNVSKKSTLSKQIKQGDQLHTIQGLSVKDFKLEEVYHFLKSLPNGRVCMTLLR